MDIRTRRLATILLAAFVATVVATAVGAQPTPTHPVFPAAPEGCRVWDAHVTYVLEQHRRDGTSGTALGEALSKAYAMYAKCVMGGVRHEWGGRRRSAQRNPRCTRTRSYYGTD